MKKILVGANEGRFKKEDFSADWLGMKVGMEVTLSDDGLTFVGETGGIRATGYWILADVADQHEQETFGPLSDDALVNPKKASGQLKAPMHTLPTLAMIQLANVMGGGAYKYGYFNFRDSKVDAQTYIGAMERHFMKWKDGVDIDRESGQHELAHLMACCAIMIDAHFTGKLIDNRSKTGLVEKMLEDSQDTFKEFMKNNKSIDEVDNAELISHEDMKKFLNTIADSSGIPRSRLDPKYNSEELMKANTDLAGNDIIGKKDDWELS